MNNFKSVDVGQFTNGLLQNKLSIAVSYFNIDTDDAKKVNSEVLEIFNDRMAHLEEDIKLNSLTRRYILELCDILYRGLCICYLGNRKL